MRPSKSRSRAKNNRRPTGNVINRVFESSGPEGKVRGTPQQIIEKYLALAQDATLGNDRVAAENFHQHAEHYTRLLGEAMREAEMRREQHEAQFRRDRGPQEGGGAGDEPRREYGAEPHEADGSGYARRDHDRSDMPREQSDMPRDRRDAGYGTEVIESGPDSGLVETPESQPRLRRGPGQRRRAPGGRTGDDGDQGGSGTGAAAGDPSAASAAE